MRWITSTPSSSPERAVIAWMSSVGALQPAWIQTWSPERMTFTASSADITLRRKASFHCMVSFPSRQRASAASPRAVPE